MSKNDAVHQASDLLIQAILNLAVVFWLWGWYGVVGYFVLYQAIKQGLLLMVRRQDAREAAADA